MRPAPAGIDPTCSPRSSALRVRTLLSTYGLARTSSFSAARPAGDMLLARTTLLRLRTVARDAAQALFVVAGLAWRTGPLDARRRVDGVRFAALRVGAAPLLDSAIPSRGLRTAGTSLVSARRGRPPRRARLRPWFCRRPPRRAWLVWKVAPYCTSCRTPSTRRPLRRPCGKASRPLALRSSYGLLPVIIASRLRRRGSCASHARRALLVVVLLVRSTSPSGGASWSSALVRFLPWR